MDSVTQLYFEAAQDLGFYPVHIPEIAGFCIMRYGRPYYFKWAKVPINDEVSSTMSCNKYLTNRLLARDGFPVPQATAYNLEEYQQDRGLALFDVPFPVVAKPMLDSSCGNDVFCNIRDKLTLTRYLDKMFEKYRYVSIEHFQANLQAYRVLILDNKAIALTQRKAAHVIGDGQRTISELVEIENEKRRKLVAELPLYDFELNEETDILLENQKITLEYVPMVDEEIQLRYVCNSSRGGIFFGLELKTIHPDNEKLLVNAAKSLNLRLVGFDVLCRDIKESIPKGEGYIIEANIGPDITIHEKISKGVQSRVSIPILKAFMNATKKPLLTRLSLHPLTYIVLAAVLGVGIYITS